MTDQQIIEQGIADALEAGKQIGMHLGKAEMLREIQKEYSNVIPHTFFVQRISEITEDLKAMEAKINGKNM